MNYSSTDEIAAANKKNGGHWFDADTLKGFNCKLYYTVYAGQFFISSEKQSSYYQPPEPRSFTIRYIEWDGGIETLELLEPGRGWHFNQYKTYAAAERALKRYLADRPGHAVGPRLQAAIEHLDRVHQMDLGADEQFQLTHAVWQVRNAWADHLKEWHNTAA